MVVDFSDILKKRANAEAIADAEAYSYSHEDFFVSNQSIVQFAGFMHVLYFVLCRGVR
jgi:hypothetical protein